MRAAIYARYSSDLQSAASIEDQIRICRERVERDGGTVVETYTDLAISGSALRTRAGMQALLADARNGRFDLVVAEALDRVSRDQEDVAGIYKRLNYADVALMTLAEGEISELHIGLKGTMNALFLKDLAQKTRRGQRGRVEAGCSAGGNSYGYQVVRRLLADGSAATGERQIDLGEAAIVCRIFEEYVRGLTPRRIATGLNAEGIPSPRGGEWNASTINGSRQRRNGILNNELYIGRIVWNRQRFVKDPDTGKRLSRLNPEHEWILADAPDLRIIDDDLWDLAQALKARFASRAGNKRQTKKRLLSGLIKCGCCGGGMTIARRDRYYCSARREKGTCNASHGIGVVEIEDRVLTGLRDILMGNEHLLEEFTAEFKRELARLRKTRSGDETRLRKELGEVERSIARCVEFVTSGDGAPGAIRDKLAELEARKRSLERALAARPGTRVVEIHPNFPDLYRRKIAELGSLLADDDERPRAMEAIRELIDRIEVLPGLKRGQCQVTLVGALAGILAFSQNATAAPKGGGTFLLVAGARNQLYLLFTVCGLIARRESCRRSGLNVGLPPHSRRSARRC